MYIAIITDNIANRKHMERVLDRTSDAIKEEIGNLYIESYGTPEAMWPSIKRYDLFFVDITQDDELKLNIVYRFMELNIQNQVIICQPDDSAFSDWSTSQGFTTLAPPLDESVLTKLILETHKNAKQTAQSKRIVEFRGEGKTYYIEAERILYAKEDSQSVKVHLSDGSLIEMYGDIDAFKRAADVYEEFDSYGKDIVINKNHIQQAKGRTITLSNNETIMLSFFGKFLS